MQKVPNDNKGFYLKLHRPHSIYLFELIREISKLFRFYASDTVKFLQVIRGADHYTAERKVARFTGKFLQTERRANDGGGGGS